jgi:hypothetical protein
MGAWHVAWVLGWYTAAGARVAHRLGRAVCTLWYSRVLFQGGCAWDTCHYSMSSPSLLRSP